MGEVNNMDTVKGETLLSNLRVLFVEDEHDAREELSRFLKRRVGKLYVASNGKEGLDQFREHNPDIIITDLKMPLMDGLEMIKNIRDLGYKPSIIVLSAMSDSETILKAVNIGIVKYIIKPVDVQDLLVNMERIASDILNDSFFIEKDKKKELEQKIKGEIAHFIKIFTGKGPQNVNVFIQGKHIDIKAVGVLTLLENNLISNNRNYSLVDYNRKLLYMENKEHLEREISNAIDNRVTLVEVEPASENNLDFIKFSFIF